MRIACGCNQLWSCPKEVFQITGVKPSSSVDPRKILMPLRDKCKEELQRSETLGLVAPVRSFFFHDATHGSTYTRILFGQPQCRTETHKIPREWVIFWYTGHDRTSTSIQYRAGSILET